MSLSAILGVTGLISALGGAGMNAYYRSKAADEVKKANDKISQNFAKQENEINKLPDNYLDTLQGRVAANQALQFSKDALSNASNNSVKTGSTQQQRLAAIKGISDMYNKSIQNLAAQSTNWAMNKMNKKLDLDNSKANFEYSYGLNKAQNQAEQGANWASLGSNLAQGAASIIGANYANPDLFKKKTNTATNPTPTPTYGPTTTYGQTPTFRQNFLIPSWTKL